MINEFSNLLVEISLDRVNSREEFFRQLSEVLLVKRLHKFLGETVMNKRIVLFENYSLGHVSQVI
jgi:hypothetical protein